MKLRNLGLAALAATTLLTFVCPASATTLEVNGVKRNESIWITGSLTAFTSMILKDTSGSFANTCTSSKVEWKTEGSFTGTTVGGTPLFQPSFNSCTEEPVIVDNPGITSSFSVEAKFASTNGTVRWAGAVITSPSPFGSLSCSMGKGTDIGTLTGSGFFRASLDVNAVLNCGFFLPSAKWEGTYTITSPEGLGVTS
ncbi:MAG TPA: hypothetical protein VGW80_06625 [Solirubrobacterales bacterium]|jgi:hypothetical protein|nr:hypothetical protein [Solirubrobacterales bacterium]